jgi:hypothetical protein
MAVLKFVAVLKRMDANDKEVERVNHEASEGGDMERLPTVEMIARDHRGGFSRGDPSILNDETGLRLPGWDHAGKLEWPLPKPSFAQTYAAAMTYPSHERGMAGVVGPGWERPEIQQRFRRSTEQERKEQAAYYAELDQQQEDRLNREEKERFAAK